MVGLTKTHLSLNYYISRSTLIKNIYTYNLEKIEFNSDSCTRIRSYMEKSHVYKKEKIYEINNI